MGQDKIDMDEWYFVLTGGVGMDNPYPNPTTYLSEKLWGEFCRMSNMPAFEGIREQFEWQEPEWKQIYDTTDAHKEPLPDHWEKDLTGLQRICALRCIRPDKVVLAVQEFVIKEMTEIFVKPPPFDILLSYNDSACNIPLVFILSPGSDPMSALVKTAEQLGREYNYISLGQGQGPIAERMIAEAQKTGTWVVLQNCHLAPSWMNALEKICEELNPDTVHESFRLWCTTYPSDVFPVPVLQNSVKMTVEPPKGIRANLVGCYTSDPIQNDEFWDGCAKEEKFHMLLFGITFFHALVQERRQYGPLGWNIPYEFNESDLKISIQQLSMFLDENDEVPYNALQYCIGECNYGGRVTDDKDRRCLNATLARFVSSDFLTEGTKIVPSGTYMVPSAMERADYVSFIESFPLVAPPETFGFHDNATITKDQNATNTLFANILLTEKGGGSGGGGGDDGKLSAVATDIQSKLPKNFDMEAAFLKYPVLWEESMNTVLCQELIRFNNLLTCIRSSLVNLLKAVKGLVVMSAELDAVGGSLFFGTIPLMWKAKSYPSLKPLGSYVSDLNARIEFFDNWLQDRPPSTFWISGFFFTQAFLTGASQNFARRYTIPIDNVDFDYEMMPKDTYRQGPKDGVYCYGFFVEGARWDKTGMCLAESLPKVLFSPAPLLLFKPVKKEDVKVVPHYNCPVYKTGDRRGILSTTGHSTNFICFVNLLSERDPAHWIQRGVAMLSQLDD